MSTNNQAPDSEEFAQRKKEYLGWMIARNFAAETIEHRSRSLGLFIEWCIAREIVRPAQVTRPILDRYARHVYNRRTKKGAPLSFRTQYHDVWILRSFFKYLVSRNHLLVSPAIDLELPKLNYNLPKAVLTHDEMERVLALPDISTDAGARDRALLEMLYSTGIRRAELTRLDLADLDVARGTLMIRQGKGNKDRVVPIGERALEWNERYLDGVRPRLALEPEERALYVTAYGKRLSEDGLSHRVTEYVNAAGIGKKGSCHLFRHTAATVMLEGGADIRAIQEMLGHSKMKATQVYTRVSIRHLKQVYEQTHPAAKRGRKKTASEIAEANLDAQTEQDAGDELDDGEPSPDAD